MKYVNEEESTIETAEKGGVTLIKVSDGSLNDDPLILGKNEGITSAHQKRTNTLLRYDVKLRKQCRD